MTSQPDTAPAQKTKRTYRKKVAVIGNPVPPAPLTPEESRLTEEEKDTIRKGFLRSEENPEPPALKKGQRLVTFISPPKAGQQLRSDKVCRNSPCQCNSGKKAKNCCGADTKYFVKRDKE